MRGGKRKNLNGRWRGPKARTEKRDIDSKTEKAFKAFRVGHRNQSRATDR